MPHTLVIAGPGSGKTRALTEHLLALTGANYPAEILALTFTRRAAAEMRARVEDLPVLPMVTTFHAWAASLIEEYAADVERSPGFTIRDEEDREEAIRLVGAELGLRWTSPERLWQEEAVRRRYDALMRESNALDYDALEVALEAIVWKRGATLRWRWRHVLVDEGQDMSARQRQILDILDPAHLYVVGDPGQGIYGFRGADPSGFLAWGSREGWTRIDLRHNYRSRPAIVRALSRIGAAMSPPGLDLIATREETDDTVGVDVCDPADLAERIRTSGHAPERCAVLAPTWAILEAVAEGLRAAEVPHELGRPPAAWETPIARWFVAALRIRANRRDAASLWTLFRTGGVTLGAWAFIRRRGRDLETDVVDGAAYMEPVRRILDAEGWRQVLACRDPLDTSELLADLDRLDAEEPLTEAAILARHAAHTLHEVAEEEQRGVRLLTVHGAKGLEWDAVWLVCPAPQYRRAEDEEDRRVFYVGSSRAREVLTYVWGPGDDGSRFVGEAL